MHDVSRSPMVAKFNHDQNWSARWVAYAREARVPRPEPASGRGGARRPSSHGALGAARTAAASLSAVPVFTIEAGQTGSGALIGDLVLMTAAHCVVDRAAAVALIAPSGDRLFRSPNQLTVSAPGGIFATAECFVHEDYIRTGDGDVAFCKLSRSLNMEPGAIDLDAALISIDAVLDLFGTGETGAKGLRPVRKMGATVKPPAAPNLVTTHLVNAGDDIQSGDSGGPAVAVRDTKRVVIGAISRASAGDIARVAHLGGVVAKRLLDRWIADGLPAITGA
jgi:hypothetical protein